MKRLILIVIILFFNNINVINGQSVIKNSNDLKVYNSIPQEGIFIHFNSTLLFTGENLFYSVYCLNSKNNHLSFVSKIAYVELIDEKGTAVFSHKIKLDNGIGQGDFLIPVSVATGNYKLISYTRWMQNGEVNNFFSSDIAIINPYESTTNLSNEISNTVELKSTIYNKLNKNENLSSNTLLGIDTDKTSYKNRAKVMVTINQNNNSLLVGNISISVRKIDNINKFTKTSSKNFVSNYKMNSIKDVKKLNDDFYLPELRGGLISGKLVSKNKNASVFNKKIGFSIPGKELIIKVATTNAEGKFYINIDKEYDVPNAIIQIREENWDDYNLVVDTHSSVDKNNLKFKKLLLNKDLENIIIERSIFNQIENAYYNGKQDSIVSREKKAPFYDLSTEYLLDNYTQFSSVREVMIEIIKGVRIIKNEKGENIFQVRSPDPYEKFTTIPGVIIDGILLQNHSDILDYDAKKVKKISITRTKHLFGSEFFEGLIVIETKEGNYYKIHEESNQIDFVLFKPLSVKKYFNQKYDNLSNYERIPDFRNQLLWIPRLKLTENNKTIEFFTSDVKGEFEISIEGFTKYGEPISIQKVISVQ